MEAKEGSRRESLRANDPDLDDVANRLSSPPLDLVSAASGCFSTALSSSRFFQHRAVPAATSADDDNDTPPPLTIDSSDDNRKGDSDYDCDSTASPLVSLSRSPASSSAHSVVPVI